VRVQLERDLLYTKTNFFSRLPADYGKREETDHGMANGNIAVVFGSPETVAWASVAILLMRPSIRSAAAALR